MNEVNKALYAALCMLRDEPEKRMPSWGRRADLRMARP